MSQKITIPRIQGSSYHQVAQSFFGREATMSPCDLFPQRLDQRVSGDCAQTVMVIENSVSRVLWFNYAVMDQYKLSSIGEYKNRQL